MKRVAVAVIAVVVVGVLVMWRMRARPSPSVPVTSSLPSSPRPTVGVTRTPSPTPTHAPSPTATSTPPVGPPPTSSAHATPRSLPEAVRGRLTLSDLFWLQDYETAITRLQRALEVAPTTEASSLHVLLARAYMGAGRYADADREWTSLLENGDLPSSVPREAYIQWARTLVALGRTEEAVQAYRTYTRDPGAPLAGYAWYQTALLLRQQERVEEALSAYRKAVAQAPREQKALWWAEWAEYLTTVGRGQEALVQVEKLLQQDGLPSSLRARVLLQRAHLYLRQDKQNEAVADLRAVLEIAAQTRGGTQPAHIDPAAIPFAYQALVLLLDMKEPVDDYTRGVIDVEAGAYAPAVPVLIRYLDSVEPHHGDAHAYLARAAAALGNTDGAVEQWQALIDTHPECPCWEDAWFSLARLYRQIGQPARAQTLMRTLIRHPQASPALRERARLYLADMSLAQGRLDLARRDYLALAYKAQGPDTRNRAALLAAVLSLPEHPQAARDVLEYALRFDVHPHWLPVLRYWLGKSAWAAGDKDSATRVWQDLAAARPTSWYAFRAAQELAEMGEPVASWQPQAVTGPDEDPPLSSQRDAIRTLLARFSPASVETTLLRAAAYGDAGLDSSAATLYTRAIDRMEDKAALLALGRILQHLGYPQLGIRAAYRALSAGDLSWAALPGEVWNLLYPVPARAYLLAVAEEFDLDPALLLALIRQESRFATLATSTANARGLMQLIPSTARYTARALGLQLAHEDELYTPRVNLQLGAYYLSSTLQRFDGDVVAALAGYNAGPGNAAYWRRAFGSDDDRFLELVPILETRTYLRQVQRQRLIYRALLQATP